MRKSILFLCFLVFTSITGYSQIKNNGCYLRMTEPANDELSFSNDSLKVSFKFNSMNYFCTIEIENKTDKSISVDWDSFIMIMENESHSILFDNTVMIDKDKPKGISNIAPKTILKKDIAPVSYIELSMPLYNKGWVKKRGDQEIGFIVPIVFDGTTKNYSCKISVSLQ